MDINLHLEEEIDEHMLVKDYEAIIIEKDYGYRALVTSYHKEGDHLFYISFDSHGTHPQVERISEITTIKDYLCSGWKVKKLYKTRDEFEKRVQITIDFV